MDCLSIESSTQFAPKIVVMVIIRYFPGGLFWIAKFLQFPSTDHDMN